MDVSTGWPTKIPLFVFGDNFYKNKDTYKIFSPQILEVYRILLVKTTLESTMFYYTFSVINTMFIPCTALLCAATRTLKLSTTPLSISCGIHLISLLMMSSLVCGLFSQTSHFSNKSLEHLTHNLPWERLILHQTNNPWPSYSQDLNPCHYFLRGVPERQFVKTIHRQERTSSEEKSDGFH